MDLHKCQLCQREVSHITLHHLIPKEEGGKNSGKVQLCQPCHSTIHFNFTNKELAKFYFNLERIIDSGRLSTFLKWIKKQSVEKISNDRRRT